MKKWILIALLILVLAGYVSFQAPGVQCPGSMVYCPGVGCVSGPEKCIPGATGGPMATFSTTWEGFTNGKDMFPEVPVFAVGSTPTVKDCRNATRAVDGRCPEFIAP
jgi:hypothetical protein